jgi:hypothetical protein
MVFGKDAREDTFGVNAVTKPLAVNGSFLWHDDESCLGRLVGQADLINKVA